MRGPREHDDTAVLAAWFLWEMFYGDEDDGGARDGAAKAEDPQPIAPRPAKKR